jgi:hypothetical protein
MRLLPELVYELLDAHSDTARPERRESWSISASHVDTGNDAGSVGSGR